MGWCRYALRLVAAVDGTAQKDVQLPCQVGIVAAHSRRFVAHHRCEHGLLDLYAETAWAFLRGNDWHNGGCGCAMGIPQLARPILAAMCVDGADVRDRLSVLWHLCVGSHVADGHLVVASDE